MTFVWFTDCGNNDSTVFYGKSFFSNIKRFNTNFSTTSVALSGEKVEFKFKAADTVLETKKRTIYGQT